MKVQLEKTFPMPALGRRRLGLSCRTSRRSPAACPGAKITERLDDRHYKGTVTVQGRAGDAVVPRRDRGAATSTPPHASLRLVGKGTDTTGTSGASMDLTARVEAVGDGASNLVGKSEVSMSGKAAAFGGRMMNSVADQILQAVRRQLRGAGRRARGRSAAGRRAGGRARRRARTARAAAAPRPTRHPAAPPSSNGLALLWAAFKDWLRGLFAQEDRHERAALRSAHGRGRRRCSSSSQQRRLHRRAPLAAALLLMLDLGRPLLLEGDAGVGKTEVAKALAAVRDTRLIRLQCYEGLDAHAAMYEWNYQRQLLAIKLLEHDERSVAAEGAGHLLRALSAEAPAARGDQLRRAAGAADRRGRPRRRGVRGLSARAAVRLPDVDSGTRHRARDVRGRSSSSRPTARASCPTRCAAAASTSTSTIPSSRRSWRSSRCARRQRPASSRARSSSSCRACAAWTCRRSPASPRRSTGRRRCCGWASPTIDDDGAERILETLSALIKTRDDRAGVHARGRRPHRGRMLIVAHSAGRSIRQSRCARA